MFKSCFIALLLLSVSFAGYAQQHVDLKQVTVQANRLSDFSSGIKTETMDSAQLAHYQNTSLATLLAEQSTVYIKLYSPGGLASSSFRGAGAGHTAVIWNGFNLQSPMHGQIDFSLLPVSTNDKITVQSGGTSTIWGSGAIGGAIVLQNNLSFEKGWQVQVGTSIGSFGNRRYDGLLAWSGKRWSSSLKLFHQQAENNFAYVNPESGSSSVQKLSNSALHSKGFLQENAFKINQKQVLNLRAWWQESDRQIPPTFTQTSSKASQYDASLRLAAEWLYSGQSTGYALRTAVFKEQLNYDDDLSQLHSQNQAHTYLAEAELKHRFNAYHLVHAGINFCAANAVSDGYATAAHQQRYAIFGAYTLKRWKDRSQTTASLRQEGVSNGLSAFTWSLGTQLQVSKKLSLRGNMAKVFRLPTFNDLYWFPGGNASLQPEKGYSEELGLNLDLIKTETTRLSIEGSAFNRNIQNWIIWLPANYYWSPRNLLNVWSRGTETKTVFTKTQGKWAIRAQVLSSYVVSTNEQSKTDGDASVGKQLIYVPIYTCQGTFSATYAACTISYTQTYTGYRYTATDHSDWLTPYSLGNIYAGYQFKYKKIRLQAFLQINNINNTTYQVLAGRPMPGRNYSTGITIAFN